MMPDGAAILVVDDEPLLRTLVAEMLREAGYCALEAGSAAEALLVLETATCIHTVFTDIDMPGDMDGLVLAALVRARWPSLTVLITSGQARCSSDLPSGTSFFAKPYSFKDITDRLV